MPVNVEKARGFLEEGSGGALLAGEPVFGGGVGSRGSVGDAGEDVVGSEAGLAEGGEGEGVVAGGEAGAVGAGDEAVVVVAGFGEAEEGLEEAVDVGGGEEVLAAGDVGDGLVGVVDDDGEVVGGGDVLAGENDVAEEEGIDCEGAEAVVAEGEGAGGEGGAPDVEAPAVGFAAGEAAGAFGCRQAAAGARVEGAFGAVRGVGHAGHFLADLAARAEARVDDVEGLELPEGVGVGGVAVRLPQRLAVPCEAQPAQVVLDGVAEFGAAAGVVDVLEAKQEAAAGCGARQVVGEAGGVSVPEVEQSGGAGGEASGHGRRGEALMEVAPQGGNPETRGLRGCRG